MSSVPINSWNEWDPLEEVIVGTCYGASSMAMEPVLTNLMGTYYRDLVEKGSLNSSVGTGKPYSKSLIEGATRQLDNFVRVLENEGVKVRRPDNLDDWNTPVKSPDWSVPCGNSATCPRDTLIVFGNEIIEAPMSIRGRFFEYRPYRTLIQEYWKKGAIWTAAPKPLMRDSLYLPYPSLEPAEKRWEVVLSGNLGLSEEEPVWDAADFLRLGKDVIAQHSLATNLSGIEWVRRHLAPKGFRVHTMQFKNPKPRHIDDTMIALRPGIVVCAQETPPLNDGLKLFIDSGWKAFQLRHSPFSRSLNLNTLSLNERTVLVEEKEIVTQKFFEDLGCRVLVVPFTNVYTLGGSFHCCTLDVKRKGTMESYFPNLDKQIK